MKPTKNFRLTKRSLEKERKEIEDQFTYVLPKKGRVILKRDRVDLDGEA